MENMGTKRTTRIFGVLCGTCLVFGFVHGRTGSPAMASDEQLPVPEVHGTWQTGQLHARPIERTRFKSQDGTPERAATAQRPASTERTVAKDAQIVKETVAGAAARKALPWVAGTLALAGLALVAYGFWTRRRPLPHRMASSITRLQISEVGLNSSGQRSSHTRLALNLVQREMPLLDVSFGDHQEEQNTRRAA
jgi:hypothetical protein